MPICPGCEESVPYDRLDLHERYCRGIWGEPTSTGIAIEKIDRRLRRIEADLEGRLARDDGGRPTVRK